MNITTEAKTLAAMLGALQAEPRPARLVAVARTVSAVVERGWAARYQVEDLLHDMGVGSFWTETDVGALFGVTRQAVFARPPARSGGAVGFDETAVADLAYLLIQIERLGLGIDPSSLVEAVLPPLRKRPMLTRSELHVFWYAKERHRMEPVTVETVSPPIYLGPERAKLATGYRIDVWRDPAGEVGSITVNAPKHRRAKSKW